MDFRVYTGKQELDTIMHDIVGIFNGIVLDKKIDVKELNFLLAWCEAQMKGRFALDDEMQGIFSIISMIEQNPKDKEIISALENISIASKFYDENTNDIQLLIGILQGIVLDEKIVAAELAGLKLWLNNHRHVENIYPYTELRKILDASNNSTKEITHKLEIFCNSFIPKKDDENNAEKFIKKDIEIKIAQNKFCVTGVSEEYKRSELETMISAKGGWCGSISQQTDFLVLCKKKSQAWVYSSYGRKIEFALAHELTIISDTQLLAALQ